MSSEQNIIRAWPVFAWWILASLVGWAIGLMLSVSLTGVAGRLPGVNEDRFLVSAGLVSVGLATGAAQARIMRGYLPRPERWIAVTILGYLLAIIPFAFDQLLRLSGPGLLDDVLLLAWIGATIGVGQSWLLRQHHHRTGIWVLASAAGLLSFLWLIANPASTPGEFVVLGSIAGTLAAAPPGVVLARLVRQRLSAVG
jgi:hypothetical protein